jgi:uncharacterized protein (TIGR03437 family)
MTSLRAAALAALFALSGAFASDCSKTSTGLLPLTHPYTGRALYPNSNQRPSEHDSAGLKFASQVRPRAASGAPDDQNGRIVLLSIGMSNTTQEFSAFKAIADRDPEKNPRVMLVDGALGGWSADRVVSNPEGYWTQVDERLQAAGVTAAQVQAMWFKDADAAPSGDSTKAAQVLQDHLKTIVLSFRPRFPNLALVYISSRIYAGYASSNLNPEPYAWGSGLSVKWLIEDQIHGSADLSYASGAAPWLAWGPYLWADGLKRREDGLTWACSELQDDGTHPSSAGQQKVALMLLDFFKTDSTARPWFVRRLNQQPPVPSIAALVNAPTYGAAVTNDSIASIFGENLAGSIAQAQSLPLPLTLAGVRVEVGGVPAPLYFVSPNQINFVLPVTPSSFQTVVVREDVRSAPVDPKITILYAPGLFAAMSPARRGQTVEIYGTGVGVRNPLILGPAIPEILPQVFFGGVSGKLEFAGPSPVYPGLFQWNATVPADAPVGDAVDVQVRYGTTASNTITIAIR